MTKKTSESKTATSNKTAKKETIQKVETPKIVSPVVNATRAKSDTPETASPILTIDGSPMNWKSRVYIPGCGTVSGMVKRSDFDTFTKLLKSRGVKTEPLDWVSSDDLMAKSKAETLENMKKRNGLT